MRASRVEGLHDSKLPTVFQDAASVMDKLFVDKVLLRAYDSMQHNHTITIDNTSDVGRLSQVVRVAN